MVSSFQKTLGQAQTVIGNIQDRLIAPCAIVDAQGSVSADIPALLNRLLIFKDYYLQSIRLREFGSLVRNLGLENVILLLDSGALKLDLNPTQFGQSGQTAPQLGIREKPSLPLLSYSFSLLLSAQRDDYLLRSIQEVHRDLCSVLGRKDLMALEGAILRAVMPIPENSGVSALLAFDSDLRANAPMFKKALMSRLRIRPDFGSVEESSVSLIVRPIDDTDFATESNLESLGLAKEEVHKIVESSLLAVGWLNRRIEDMESYHALSGAIDEELPLFGEKFKFLAASLSPKLKEDTFDKVLRIGRFPSFDFETPTNRFDMQKFLKVRESKECSEFRDWLKHAQFFDEQEIHSQVGSLRARLGTLVHGTKGKLIRLALGTGVGAVPVLGVPLGFAYGVLDTFVLEKVLPLSGPAMFLDVMYGSLFAPRSGVSAEQD
jgi:hypothetical protein